MVMDAHITDDVASPMQLVIPVGCTSKIQEDIHREYVFLRESKTMIQLSFEVCGISTADGWFAMMIF